MKLKKKNAKVTVSSQLVRNVLKNQEALKFD